MPDQIPEHLPYKKLVLINMYRLPFGFLVLFLTGCKSPQIEAPAAKTAGHIAGVTSVNGKEVTIQAFQPAHIRSEDSDKGGYRIRFSLKNVDNISKDYLKLALNVTFPDPNREPEPTPVEIPLKKLLKDYNILSDSCTFIIYIPARPAITKKFNINIILKYKDEELATTMVPFQEDKIIEKPEEWVCAHFGYRPGFKTALSKYKVHLLFLNSYVILLLILFLPLL